MTKAIISRKYASRLLQLVNNVPDKNGQILSANSEAKLREFLQDRDISHVQIAKAIEIAKCEIDGIFTQCFEVDLSKTIAD